MGSFMDWLNEQDSYLKSNMDYHEVGAGPAAGFDGVSVGNTGAGIVTNERSGDYVPISDGTPVSGASADNKLDPSGYSQAEWYMTMQRELDEQERLFNSNEAQKLRDWQEMMSNTSVQRLVKDIKAAGLNPWLALNGGNVSGASTPSGASASSSSGKATVPNAMIYKAMLSVMSKLYSSALSLIDFF